MKFEDYIEKTLVFGFRLSVFGLCGLPFYGFIFRFCIQVAGAWYVFCDELNDEMSRWFGVGNKPPDGARIRCQTQSFMDYSFLV